ncbi:hypothetical protein FSZ31_00960 [Sphingorhabdus soli]|uniref:Uncharacterized protein n=1 Tax=Flavisphingopyxis soli TaxID=2601267 RepID=A0A5C6UQR3_9SPHN|nr:hypothetical protein [Sphingorhabdus soli]TXC73365.1 hypothetical protein FSZ31_00960 [Sphingorhabdus soli]
MTGTRYEWWKDLAGRSSTIAGLPVPADEDYWDHATNQAVNAVAYNLSGCEDHNTSIARWADMMANRGVPLRQIEKLLVDLTSRNTYGAFSEIAAYGLLLDSDISYRMQVPMRGTAILNPNGSDLDGVLEISTPVYFDVKSFGLHEYLAEELRRKLTPIFTSNFVSIGGSVDVGVNVLSDLLGKDFKALVAELTSKQKATRNALEIRLDHKRRVQFVTNTANPYEFAKNHAHYAFKFAKQFVRRKPFILVFVIHPWLGGFRLSNNFCNDTEHFMRSFARRTFMQFRSDRSKLLGVTRAAASKLLSGVMFVDAWQKPSDKSRNHALYLNPYAKHPMPKLCRDRLVCSIRDMRYDDFEHDAY